MNIATTEQWKAARLALLEREKALTRQRDELAKERRSLPWVPVHEDYAFETESGSRRLSELFEGRSQLVVYHFMLGPEWTKPCKSCSFWADNFQGAIPHLRARDITMKVVSRAPLAKIREIKARMGWGFDWVSSYPSQFNFDFGVSFVEGEMGEYNYREIEATMDELPGLSCFAKDAYGKVYHTYSCYSRGLDGINGAYQIIDLTAKGRDEDGLAYGMEWVRLRDEYEPVPA